MVTLTVFIHTLNGVLQYKQHHMKLLFRGFYSNGQTRGFHPQTQLCTAKPTVPQEITAHLNFVAMGFSQDSTRS